MPATAARLRTSLHSWSFRVAAEWAPELADAMRPEAPIGKALPGSRPPGELRASIVADRPRPSPSGAAFTLSAPVIQAATTDKGARAHVIRPKRARVLRFYSESAGRTVFARQVNHPGNPPAPWWEQGLQRVGSISLRRAARRVRL